MKIDAVHHYFNRHQQVIAKVSEDLSEKIIQIAEAISNALKCGNKVLIMGNGGSAADSQHFAAELVGRYLVERRGLPAIALTTDTSILTAVGNDYGFDHIFSRQVQALAEVGDIVIGLSTSGHSKNVLKAFHSADKIGCKTIGLLGRDGGAIRDAANLALVIEENETPYIQEAHGAILHLICALVEEDVTKSEYKNK
jgi:D-sedoheptulose 7-phosphate isomerase